MIELFSFTQKPFLLKATMFAPTDELYLLDAQTLALVHMSEHVLKQRNLSLQEAQSINLEDLLGLRPLEIREHLKTLSDMNAEGVSVAGDLDARVVMLHADNQDYLLIIKDTLLLNKAVEALIETEARFEAMVFNSPGMFFQFTLDAQGELRFVYLSGGSKSLLGLEAETLYQDNKAFYSILNVRDHTNFNTRLKASKADLSVLDWEGRVWIDGWQDTKWINLRATPKQRPNGEIMWDGIMINISQSKKERFEIEQSRRNLAELTAHMNTIREDERKKVARELHDDLGGNLTAIKMGLAATLDKIQRQSGDLTTHIQQLISVVDGTFDTVHKISGNLRPNILDLGIVDALEWQAKEFQKQINIPTKFTTNRSEISLSSAQALALFRICQEALSNIAKYAKASEVGVDISVIADHAVMTISDNGVGIKSNDKLKSNSFGLRGMQERMAAVLGQFDISPLNTTSTSKKGTRITAKIPI